MNASDETPETEITDIETAGSGNGSPETETAGSGNDRPLLRIVRGEPDAEELAALTAVVAGLAASGGGDADADSAQRSRWADRGALVRAPLTPGPGAWRASALRR